MTRPRRYERDELLRFLQAVDHCLEEPAKMILIGGSAIILAYGVSTTTVDIDMLNGNSAALEKACRQASAQTGLTPPVSMAGVAQVPEHSEDRLVRHHTGGSSLELYVLEKHDLAISKALRGDARDHQHLMALHKSARLRLTGVTIRRPGDTDIRWRSCRSDCLLPLDRRGALWRDAPRAS